MSAFCFCSIFITKPTLASGNLGLGKVTELLGASIAFQFRLFQHSRKFREPRPCGLAGKIAQRQEYAPDSRVTVS